ncbi:MAG TPA: secretin N-terminal domain-containing protein [Steroidobacteraceae bacterium]
MKTLLLTLTTILSALPLATMAADSESKFIASDAPHDSRDVDTRALIREVGARIHKRFVWDPRIPQTVNLGTLDRQDVTYGQLLALLRIYSCAVIQDDSIVEVIPDAFASRVGQPLLSADNLKTLDDEWVTVIVPVKGMSAVQLITILRPLVPTTGQINASSERNAMIISDRSANVRRIIELTKGLENLPPVSTEVRREQ